MKPKCRIKVLTVLLLILYTSALIGQKHQPLFSPSLQPRMAAEWEPAVGVLFSWPLSLPHRLIIELAKDTNPYVLVETESGKQEALTWFYKWGIDTSRVHFIISPQGPDVSWTRDWGPHAVFNTDGKMSLADGKYIYSTPVVGMECDTIKVFLYKTKDGTIELTTTDDQIPDYIAKMIGVDIEYLPFALTGGNVFSDGQHSAFSTCALTTENKYMGVSDSLFLQETKRLLGIDQYHFISNFEINGIQHIDCYLNLLDEERILVTKPPKNHPLYQYYENIVTQELGKLTNAYGRPYQILRLDTDRYRKDQLAAYSNSLILNQTIYVPLFGIPQDTIALRQWADAMPGYQIKGFEFVLKQEPSLRSDMHKHYTEIGWNSGDALHCRTRAIWDPNMIYMSVDRVPKTDTSRKTYSIQSIIKGYGNSTLATKSAHLIWRTTGNSKWNKTKLKANTIQDQYLATIKKVQNLEFYISVENKKGQKRTMPATAPRQYYKYK